MKKILLIILPLFLLFFPFSVHAEAVPTISSSTYELIDGGINDLNTRGLADYGVFPYMIDTVSDIIADFLPIPTSLNANDFVIRPLSEVEKEDIESGFTQHFYNTLGEEISIDDLYLVYGNNGYYKANFYIDSNGDVLFSDEEHSNVLLTLGLDDFTDPIDDSGNSYRSWQDVYSALAEKIATNNYNYYPTTEDFVDNTYFVRFGYYDSSANPLRTGYVYIPNQSVPGLIVPINTNGHIQSWYTNDPSLISLVFDSGTPLQNQINISSGTYTVNGVTYDYLVKLQSNFGSGRTDVSLSDFLSSNFTPTNVRLCTFESSSYIYGDQISYSPGVFRKMQMLEVPSVSPDEMYNYDELTVSVPQSEPAINPSYNPDLPISPDNYPVIYPNPLQVVIPSVSPIPGVNPQIDPVPNPFGDVVTIDPDELPDNIPFIQNLERRFPFSIPWDIKRLLNGLNSTAVTPRFEISWYIQPLDYTWEFALDLTDFNDVAMLFRTLFLISFIIGLAIFSYNHFFGS